MTRTEAENRAHDRVSPDAVLNSIAAVNLYVEAFLDGARYADDRQKAARWADTLRARREAAYFDAGVEFWTAAVAMGELRTR